MHVCMGILPPRGVLRVWEIPCRYRWICFVAPLTGVLTRSAEKGAMFLQPGSLRSLPLKLLRQYWTVTGSAWNISVRVFGFQGIILFYQQTE